MVLAVCAGGVVDGHTPTRRWITRVRCEDGGSQALEFAMVLPLFGLLIALLAQTGLLLGDVVMAQGIAREVARTAAVEDESAARAVGHDLAGRRRLRVELSQADGLIEARVQLRSTVFASTGAHVWLPARAVMRSEHVTLDGAAGERERAGGWGSDG
jgi:TadE-like protein